MQNKEKIERDLAIGLDFVENILQNPDMLDEIPNGTTISFLDRDMPNIERIKEDSIKRKYVKVKRNFELL